MNGSKKIFNRITALILALAVLCGSASFAFAAALKDGVYSVNVTMTGGSGKTEIISPARLVVSGGQMKATVSFDSEYYTTMTVNGAVYNNENKGGYSTWTIPVAALDQGIKVSAVTEKMSTPHEIEYTITFSSAGISSNENNSTPDKTDNAPDPSADKKPDKNTAAEKPAGDDGNNTDNEDGKEAGDVLIFENSYSSSTSVTSEQLKDYKDKTMTISTVKGKVEFDKEALASIAEKAADGITLDMEELTDDEKYADSGYGKVIDLILKDGRGNLLYSSETKGKAKVTIKYDAEVKNADKIKVYRLSEDDKEEIKAVYNEEEKTVTFETDHFSIYAVGEGGKKNAAEDEDKNGVSPAAIAGIAAIVIAAAGAGFAVYKKKKGNADEEF